jgi:hypothetical protein
VEERDGKRADECVNSVCMGSRFDPADAVGEYMHDYR